MLNQGIPDKTLDNIVFGLHRPLATRRCPIDGLIDLALLRVDIVNGILLRGQDVNPTFVIGGETCLLRAAISRVLYCSEDIGFSRGSIDDDFL